MDTIEDSEDYIDSHPQKSVVDVPALLADEPSPSEVPTRTALGADLIELVDFGDWTEPQAKRNAIEALLRAGADPDATNDDDLTALQIVIGSSPRHSPIIADIVTLLLAYGADANRVGPYDFSPLDQAYATANDEIFRVLWSAGARFTDTIRGADSAQRKAVELSLSCLLGDTEAVDRLLDKGIAINARDAEGTTALHTAAKSGDAAIVAHLLARGADIHARADATSYTWDTTGSIVPVTHALQGYMPLHYAAQEENSEVVRLLLSHGADIYALSGPRFNDAVGDYPLGLAIQYLDFYSNPNEAKETIRILLDQHSHMASLPVERTNHTRSYLAKALANASNRGCPELVTHILEYGAGEHREDLLSAMSAALVDNSIFSILPLWEAGKKLIPSLTLVEILSFLYGSPTKNKDTVYGVLPWMIQHIPDMDVTVPDPKTGETPLLWAIRNVGAEEEGHLKPYFQGDEAYLGFDTFEHSAIWQLLAHGADPNIRDARGDSALSVAQAQGYETLLLLLEYPERIVADYRARTEQKELVRKLSWTYKGTVEEKESYLKRLEEITWWAPYTGWIGYYREKIESLRLRRDQDSLRNTGTPSIPLEQGR